MSRTSGSFKSSILKIKEIFTLEIRIQYVNAHELSQLGPEVGFRRTLNFFRSGSDVANRLQAVLGSKKHASSKGEY